MKTAHYARDRRERENLIQEIGEGNIIKTVIIDRGNKLGAEVHQISDTGIITISGEKTKKIITKLIAKPTQIARYYNQNEEIPERVIEIARRHKRLKYNLV